MRIRRPPLPTRAALSSRRPQAEFSGLIAQGTPFKSVLLDANWTGFPSISAAYQGAARDLGLGFQ
jgi:hypothetical protein